MRKRLSSRLLILDLQGRVLLFRFTHNNGALAGQEFWATPGGGLEPGEAFEAAAVRELKEETGIEIANPGAQVARREFVLQLPDGEFVEADERYFVIKANNPVISSAEWSALEREVMTDHRWWSVSDLETTDETVWPENLTMLVRSAAEIG